MSRLLFESRAAVLACEAKQALIEKEIELEKLKQQRKPLTDEQIAEIAATPCAVAGSYVHTFARAIEAAHGIKE